MKDAIIMFCVAIAIAFSVWGLCVSFSNKEIMSENNKVLKEINSDSSYHNRDSLINKVTDLEFEKNSYIQFMDSQSNIIIGYVTLLFALFGITGLVISNRLAQHIKEDYEKEKSEAKGQFRSYRIEQQRKYQKHTSEIKEIYEKHTNEILEFRKEIAYMQFLLFENSATISAMFANDLENIEIHKKFLYMVSACSYAKKCLDIKQNPKMLSNINSALVFSINLFSNPNFKFKTDPEIQSNLSFVKKVLYDLINIDNEQIKKYSIELLSNIDKSME